MTQRVIRALTIHQPWAHCIAHLGKRLENREWRPPRWMKGQLLAIHAGKTVDRDAIEDLILDGFDVPNNKHSYVTGAVVAVAKLHGSTSKCPDRNHQQFVWWSGTYAWILTDVVTLPHPIECRGYQKLWRLPTDAAAGASRQWEEMNSKNRPPESLGGAPKPFGTGHG